MNAQTRTMISLLCVTIAMLFVAACGGDDDKGTTTNPTKTPSPGSVTLPTSVACPGGTSISVSDIPECKAYLTKFVSECCPKATTQYLDTSLQALACAGAVGGASSINQACKMTMDSAAFSQACSAAKSSPTCK